MLSSNQTFDPVASARALKELNALPRNEATKAAFAYLVGEYGDMADLLNATLRLAIMTGGDIAHEDAWTYLEDLLRSASELTEESEGHIAEIASRNPYDAVSDRRMEGAA